MAASLEALTISYRRVALCQYVFILFEITFRTHKGGLYIEG